MIRYNVRFEFDDYCENCMSEQITEIRTEDIITLMCDSCGYEEVLTIVKHRIEFGYIPLDGDNDLCYGNL